MEDNKTIIFFDNSDSANLGWAWRNGQGSQGIHEGAALDSMSEGGSVDSGELYWLREELQSDGVDLSTCVLVIGGEEIGHIWP